MDRVMRHVQLLADLSLGKIAGQQFEHHEFPGCQLLIPVLGVYPRPVPEGGQPPGQDPRIGARFDDGSRFGDHGVRALARAQGAMHGRVVQHRVRHLGRLAPAPQHERNTALDQRLRLLRPSARGEETPTATSTSPLAVSVPRSCTRSIACSASSRCSSRRPRSPAMSER